MSFLSKFEDKPVKEPLTENQIDQLKIILNQMYETLFVDKTDNYKRLAMQRVISNTDSYLYEIVAEINKVGLEYKVNGSDIKTIVIEVAKQKLDELPIEDPMAI